MGYTTHKYVVCWAPPYLNKMIFFVFRGVGIKTFKTFDAPTTFPSCALKVPDGSQWCSKCVPKFPSIPQYHHTLSHICMVTNCFEVIKNSPSLMDCSSVYSICLFFSRTNETCDKKWACWIRKDLDQFIVGVVMFQSIGLRCRLCISYRKQSKW